MPAEKPIIFNGEMVRALLNGDKTQTRRVVKGDGQQATGWFQPGEYRRNFQPYADAVGDRGGHRFKGDKIACPYGRPGDLLWVREKWLPDPNADADAWADEGLSYVEWSGCGASIRGVPMGLRNPENCIYAASWDGPELAWRPSIHMPKWAARLWLRVVDVRVERVQDITDSGADAEGACIPQNEEPPSWFREDRWPEENFASLWDSINAKRGYGWDQNPFVWRISFERIDHAVAER